jgi:1,2-phenylacetyl-CoA epoxidase catalytic subunit
MKKTNKSFDCVEMMHEGALRIYEELKGKTREEKLAYWRKRDEATRREHPRLRELDHADRAAK